MTNTTHQTAATQYIEANGIRFAYRRFGKPGGIPLVFNQHRLFIAYSVVEPIVSPQTDFRSPEADIVRRQSQLIVVGVALY